MTIMDNNIQVDIRQIAMILVVRQKTIDRFCQGGQNLANKNLCFG
jgi:plasmid maintenance system antidote protein VapI